LGKYNEPLYTGQIDID